MQFASTGVRAPPAYGRTSIVLVYLGKRMTKKPDQHAHPITEQRYRFPATSSFGKLGNKNKHANHNHHININCLHGRYPTHHVHRDVGCLSAHSSATGGLMVDDGLSVVYHTTSKPVFRTDFLAFLSVVCLCRVSP